jgi:hypothetical protein
MNKRQGRKMSRYIKNKSRKVSNVGYPIHIEDDETKETQDNTSWEKESSPIVGKPVEEKYRIDTSL